MAGYSEAHMHPVNVASNKVTVYTGAWLYGVHRTCTKMAAVSRGTSHVKPASAVTISVDIQNVLYASLFCNGHNDGPYSRSPLNPQANYHHG